MRIRPVDIEIPNCNPFKYDLLDRESTVQILTNMLQNLESPYTMSIDSSWGNGKTTFLNMWKLHLVNQGFPVVSFNAWETDFTGSPFVALSSELLSALERHKGKRSPQLKEIRKHASNLGKVILVKGVPGAITLTGVAVGAETNDPFVTYAFGVAANTISSILNKLLNRFRRNKVHAPVTYADAISAVDSFKRELEVVARTLTQDPDRKPLVIAIDELDRCRPSYAIELLEIAKHIFAVDNIVFVLAIDKAQLSHAIRAIYGSEFDANGYLRRFIDLDFRLPDPDRTEFVARHMNVAQVLHHFDRFRLNYIGPNAEVRQLLNEFLKSSSLSLRQVQQAVIRLGLALASIDQNTSFSFPAFVIMLLLRTLDPVTYQRFVRSDLTDKQVSDHLFNSPGLRGLRQTGISALFEALLIMADDEFRKKNSAQRKPTEISLYSYYNGFTVQRHPDPAINVRAESVLKCLERYQALHEDISPVYFIGFADAARHIELLYDILPIDSSTHDTTETSHLTG